MKSYINNKYLSGLLAGVLTAGIVQGSKDEGKMPELGEKQTSVVHAQSIDGLPAELQELFLAFSQSLAERGYQAQINLSSVQMPTQITSINTFALNGNIEQTVNGKKKQLDSYSMLQVAQYLNTDSIKTVQEVNSKFTKEPSTRKIQDHGKLINQLKKNPSPITEENCNLYSNIETQQIFGPNDYILPGMHQYIITYPVTKAEIEAWITKLENMHANKAPTPIVFEYQLLPYYSNTDPMQEEKDDIFKIKAYWCGKGRIDSYDFEEFYRKLQPYMNKKRIVFVGVSIDSRKNIEKSFDLSRVEIRSWRQGSWVTYGRYLREKDQYQNDNLIFSTVEIYGNLIMGPEEQRRQLKVLSMDKQVNELKGGSNSGYSNLEFLGNVKCSYGFEINPNHLQKQRNITFITNKNLVNGQLSNRKIYKFGTENRDKGIVAEKVREYVQYVKDHNLEYLSGFVNFANKPVYLTNEEWRKVIVLTGMVEELMDLVDQKFNEYETNHDSDLVTDSYGCGGACGCTGYNPYVKYYYGCGYDC